MGEKTEHIRCLAEFIRNLTWEQVPEDVKELAVMRVLDLISVAVGAAGDPMIVKIGDMLEKGKEQETAVYGDGRSSFLRHRQLC